MSGAKKGAAEARAAMAELVGELDRTRKEFAKATLQLTHLETTVQHLKDAEMKKDQVIAHLESELARREASFSEELSILQEEARSKEAAFAHRTRFLDMEVTRLKQEVEVANTYEKENRQLRETVLENQATIEKLQVLNEELRTRAKEDARDHASQLEAEFKRRLGESEKKFRAEAYRALSEEAKIALQGNDHLQTVLQRQNDSIEAVLLKCKHLEQAHSKIAGEQEISAQNLQHHVAEIQRLKKQLNDARGRNTQLEEALRQRKVERASLELLYIEYESGRKQLAKEKERCRRATREAERWRNRSVQLTHELTGDQREAAEAKLVALSSHNATMEAHATKTRQRQDRLERAREKNQAGAGMLRQAGGATPDPDDLGGGADDDWSQVSSDDGNAIDDAVLSGARGPTVNPMEILAMWNANFDGGRGGGGLPGQIAAGSEAMADDETLMLEHRGGESAATPTSRQSPLDDGAGDPSPERGTSSSARNQQPHQHHGGPVAAPIAKPTSAPLRDASTAHASSAGPPGSATEQGGAGLTNASSSGGPRLNPVRPPPRVDDTRKDRDKMLSVLSQPKQSTLPAPARSFAVQQHTMQMKRQAAPALAPGSNLTVVSHGVAKPRVGGGAAGKGASAARFITP
jgi:hypothetical protein